MTTTTKNDLSIVQKCGEAGTENILVWRVCAGIFTPPQEKEGQFVCQMKRTVRETLPPNGVIFEYFKLY